jgi:hypothetical protein
MDSCWIGIHVVMNARAAQQQPLSTHLWYASRLLVVCAVYNHRILYSSWSGMETTVSGARCRPLSSSPPQLLLDSFTLVLTPEEMVVST